MSFARTYFTNIFKLLAIVLLALPIVFFVLAPRADAATGILKQINFQGKVVNTNGTNVTNASYNFLFCLYTVASPATPCTAGANNDAVWRESKSLTVTDGVFQTLLGDTTALPGSVDFNTDNIYLGVNFNSDGQMTPLVRFSAVPYAFNADKIHGLTVTDTTGTFTLTNSKTLSVSNTLTFAGTDSTTITFQGTDTYVGRATTDTLTNKTIGSTGLIFSGATTDIDTVSNEDLTLAVNGSGNFVFSGDFDSGVTFGTAISNEFPLLVRSGIGNNSALAVDNLNGGDIFTASSAGTTRFSVTSAGGIKLGTAEGSANNCLLSGGVGVASSWGSCGGGSQTPWTTDIDADNFSLLDFGPNITARGALTLASGAGTNIALSPGTTGDVIFTHGDGSQFAINATPTTDVAGQDSFKLTLNPTITGSTQVLRGLVISQSDNANTGVYDSLAYIQNLKTPETTANGLLIEQNAASGTLTNGLQILNTAGTITNGIQLTGTFATALFDSPTLDITAAGNITGVATSITGSSNLTLTPAAASSLTLGTTGVGNTTSITLSTDSTGDAEVVLPGQSISAGEILNDTITSTQLNAALTFSALDFVDLGLIVHNTTANQGLRLPNAASATPSNPTSGEGYLAWDTAGNQLITYNGAAWATVGGGGGGTLQQAYTADADGSNAVILMTSADGSIVFQNVAGTQFAVNMATTTAPTIDMMNIANNGASQGVTTSGVDGLQIDFNQADDADGTDTNYGLNINVTAASADAGDILAALHANVTTPTANNREIGIDIGSGFDEDIHFASGAARIRFQDGGSINFTDGSMGGGGTNKDLPQARLIEYFASANYGVFEAGGFINIDGSFRMDQFVRSTANITADAIGTAGRIGDYGDWSLDEAGTGAGGTNTQQVGCVVRSAGDTNFTQVINGVMDLRPDTTTVTNAMNNWCMLHHAGGNGSTATNNGILAVANKFIFYYKVRLGSNVTNTISSKYIYLGVNNLTGGTTGRPANAAGIWFSNVAGNQTNTGTNYAGGTAWLGNVNNGTNATNHSTVACSGANLSVNTSTTAWALMRVEARATNDIRFFIDSDVSNGVALTECGSVTNNIPTNQMKPSIMVAHALTINQTWNLMVDLFAYVQDDPRDGPGSSLTGLEENNSVPAPPNPILGADLAENYIVDGTFEAGDLVVLGQRPGVAERSDRPNDRKLLGVVSESPSLMIGETASGFTMAPIALTGRVPVRVSSKNGEIRKGDPITSSEIPGVGVRARTPGKIIGTAMEDFNNPEEGKIMVNINVGYYIGDESDTALLEQPDELEISSSSPGNFSIDQGIAVNASSSGEFNASASAGITIGTRLQNALEYFDNMIFRGIVEFIGRVIFRNEVQFEGEVVFNKDTAGYAQIKKGQKFVDVTFEKEYKNQPVINISPTVIKVTDEIFQQLISDGLCTELEGIEVCQDKVADQTLSSGAKYAIQNQTTQGFLIVLDNQAPYDLNFSWQATAVKDVRTAKSDGPAGLVLPFEGDYQPSNKFGEHSNDPKIKDKDLRLGLKGHDGLDIPMPIGTDVLAVDDGEVEIENNDYGSTIYIKHSWGKTTYGHLSQTLVKVGDKVSKGQKIALSGNSGLTTGPHLHFGLALNKSKQDNGYVGFENPWRYLSFGKPKAPEESVAGVSTQSASLSPTLTPTSSPSPGPEESLPEGLTVED